MKKLIWMIFAIVLLWSCASEETKNHNVVNENNKIVIGTHDTLFSNILNENRELIIHIPSEYKSSYPKINYPVIYLFDPEPHFLSVVALMDRMSVNVAEEICPQMIVVGIKNTKRIRDMFPIQNEDRFNQFLEQELIPFIDNKYPTKPYRVLIGHSITGLRTIHTAIFNPKLFNSFIAIDPSLCHEYCKWFEKRKHAIDTFSMKDSRIFLAMAHTMPTEMDTVEIKNDTSGRATHMNSMMYLSNKMVSKNEPLDPKFKWKYYPSESHNSVTLPAIYDGLKANFAWYKFPDYNKLLSTETSPEAAVSLLQTHYEVISEKLGYREIPSEGLTSMLVTYLQFQDQYEKALKFAELNLVNYPKSEKVKMQLSEIENSISKVND